MGNSHLNQFQAAGGLNLILARIICLVPSLAVLAMAAAMLSVEPLCVRSAGAEQQPWVGNTSGPFFTGTADVEPYGSWYYEPFVFDSIQHNSSQINVLQKLSVGLPFDMEFDLFVPTLYAQGRTTNHFGLGDVGLQLKKQLLKDADPYHFLAMPSVAVLGNVTLPTGQYQSLSPALDGTDQGGNGTYDLDLSVEMRKQAAPFQFYLQFADYLFHPSNVHGPYTFNNGLKQIPLGSSLHMVDGNLLYYAAAFEHVLDSETGFGYLIEGYGETQGHTNLVFGTANAPAWSALWLAPEVEITWPNRTNFSIAWGAGVAVPVMRHNYPRSVIPMATATFYFNSGGSR